eukprot:TRINITY_DN7567_c0_g2_i1.p1 TRINITY_DN7567_c0_g2~~TRINITY_DN7567_c0_g2_i1.p1  ORF type:complete len:197 (-),score=6.95 TRINITY_DN7567_c0_g2_i1:266-856(-)
MAGQGRFRVSLERGVPRGGADELYAKYFSEVYLDTVEEQTFKRRVIEEVGPRLVHLRLNAIGKVAIPAHIEENPAGEPPRQLWTGHAKVDRNLFVMDREHEIHSRRVKYLRVPRMVPALRMRLVRAQDSTVKSLSSRDCGGALRTGLSWSLPKETAFGGGIANLSGVAFAPHSARDPSRVHMSSNHPAGKYTVSSP